jgi:hypothetical protein
LQVQAIKLPRASRISESKPTGPRITSERSSSKLLFNALHRSHLAISLLELEMLQVTQISAISILPTGSMGIPRNQNITSNFSSKSQLRMLLTAQPQLLLFLLEPTTAPIAMSQLRFLMSVPLPALHVRPIPLLTQPKDNAFSVIQSVPLARVSAPPLIHVHVTPQLHIIMVLLAFHVSYLIIGIKTA